MSILDVRQEIDKNLAEIAVIDSLISSFEELNNESMQKIVRYKATIDGAYKDQRYGLVLDCRDAINKEMAEISGRDKLIRERDRQKKHLAKRNDELLIDLRRAWHKEMEARSKRQTDKH